MKSTDERMAEVLGRARAHEAATWRRRQRVVALGGGVLSVVAVVAIGFGVASVGPLGILQLNGSFGLMGSVFSVSSALGYIVVGLLGIALGVAVTMLAYRFGRKAERLEELPVEASKTERANGERPEP